MNTNRTKLVTALCATLLCVAAERSSGQSYYYRPPQGATANTTPALRYGNPYTIPAIRYTGQAAGNFVAGGVNMYRGNVPGAASNIVGLYENTGRAYDAWQSRRYYMPPPPPRYYYRSR
jgi:hypothetical protein